MKDTFYFSHDYNTRMDQRIKELIRKHGMTGYGLFWAIVEDLYNNANALPTHCQGIADDYRVAEDVVISVLNDFDLFVINDGFFSSLSVERRIFERNRKSDTARELANKRWSKNAKAMRPAMLRQCQGNAIKEIKGKEINTNTLERAHTKLFSNSEVNTPEKFIAALPPEWANIDLLFYFHQIKDWSASGNKKKADWIATARNWIRKEKADKHLRLKQ